MPSAIETQRKVVSNERDSQKVLTIFIFLAYFGQGLAQHFCLIAQPLDNYFLKTYHWNAAQVANFMGMLMIPWTIKPIFGFISDSFPIFGSTKKSYLTLGFTLGGIGYLLASAPDDRFLALSLVLSSVGLACASAVSLGLIVENYAASTLPNIFSLQLFAYYLSLIGSGVFAGWLCNQQTPIVAVNSSLLLSAAVCIATAFATPLMATEKYAAERSLSVILSLMKRVGTDKRFLLVAAFIFCWSFSPGFGTPLYFHYTNVLHMSQLKIGEASGYHAFGMLVGVILYSLLWKLAPKLQMQISVWLCVLSTALFTQVSENNAPALELLRGVTSMLGALSINALAASVSLPKVETITTAILMSVYNLGTLSSGIIGANLYASVFNNALQPLLFLSALATAACSPVLIVMARRRC